MNPKILRRGARKAEKLVREITPAPGPLTAEQKEEWRYVIENAPCNVLKNIDKAALAGFIVAQDTHRKASVAMAQTELLVKSPTQGLPLQNPYLPIVNRQAALMTRLASELGFTPCSRARVDAGAMPTRAASDWDDIVAR